MEIKYNSDLPKSVDIAINIMRNSFGGTNVKLVGEKLYRTKPDEFCKLGRLGIDIEIEGVKTFMGIESLAEDIAFLPPPYGQMIADEFVYNIIKNISGKTISDDLISIKPI